MTTMNISLPDSLKSFVDEQVEGRGYGSSSEYVRDLIRRDLDRERLRGLLLEGPASGVAEPLEPGFFDALRTRIRGGE
jgi:antitoxin ParD1/3/4